MAAWFYYMGVGKPLRLQYVLAEGIQHGGTYQMHLCYRGFGKSVINACATDWWGYTNPDCLALIRSGVVQKAKDFLKLTKDSLDIVPFLKHMKPIRGEGDADGAFRFDFGHRKTPGKDPSVAAYGIFSMATGSHPLKIIDDDLETKENSGTVEARAKLTTKLNEAPLLLLPEPDRQHIVVGTYQSVDSIYAPLEARYRVYRIPDRYPTLGAVRLLPELEADLRKDPTLVGKPTCPERFDEIILTEIEAGMTKAEYSLQMALDPTMNDLLRYPLKLRDLMVWPTDPDIGPRRVAHGNIKPWQGESAGLGDDRLHYPMHVSEEWDKWEQTIMFIDPSGRGRDETAYAIVSSLNGILYCSEVNGFKEGSSPETMLVIAKAAARWKVNQILVEPNFGDGMYTALLRPVVAKECGDRPIAVEDAPRASGQKEKRILKVLEPVFSAHRLVVSPSVAADPVLMFQITRLSGDRGCLEHDDRVEALSGAVAHYQLEVSRDVSRAAMAKAQAELDRRHKDWDKTLRKKSGVVIMPTPNVVPSSKGVWSKANWLRRPSKRPPLY